MSNAGSRARDFEDEDVTDLDDDQLGSLIRQRVRTNPSVQLFRKRVQSRMRLMLRTWFVEFDVE